MGHWQSPVSIELDCFEDAERVEDPILLERPCKHPRIGAQLGHRMSRESDSKRNFVALYEHVRYFRNLN